MTNRNDNRKQPHTGSSKSAQTEVSSELANAKETMKTKTKEKNNR